ncbi:hypothetical protein [Paludisphaera sp.]|uniref:hypothetical protein n=1 Tax=Paludisphaera sp. TaxID=2017432 RepID=UPI00301CC9E3
MKTRTAKLAALGMLLAPLVALNVGCEREGPAERAGERIDRAADNAVNALDPRGPAEKAGAAVDNAADRASDAVNP